jgi:hypothetical protein
MTNILLHGASVTQQGNESSYFEQLLKVVNPATSLNLRKKGYGGCHFHDAGFLTIDTDTDEPTDICILEWNTTGQGWFDENKLTYVAGKLMSKKIMPIFLILARADTINANRKSEDQILDFCSKNKILCLDYRNLINPQIDLRDNVHTTEQGAIKYAQKLYGDLLAFLGVFNKESIQLLKFPNYRINPMRDLAICMIEGDSCIIKLRDISSGAHVIIETVHGPSSGIVDVNNGEFRVCIWDQWSHFERPGFVIIAEKITEFEQGSSSIRLVVLPDLVDYSSCQREFSFGGKKELKIKGIFGINCLPFDVEVSSI